MAGAFLSSTISELNRRRVFRVATMYAVVAWIVLQLGEITFEPLQLPPWALTALIIVVLLGFPVVMALAWVFDWTADGIKRTAADENTSSSRPMLLLITVLGLDAVVGYYLYSIYVPRAAASAQEAPAPLAGTPAGGDNFVVQNAQPAPPNSIAVLPFIDMSPGGDQEYFADGISEALQDVIARIEGVRVAARTSSFAFKGRAHDVRAVGRALNVATILEGTVRKQDESVQIRAELIDAESGSVLWSNRFERSTDEILQIQGEIADAIAEQLVGSYEGFAAVEQATGAPASFEAYDSYLRGREEWRKRTPASLERAIAIFKRTIELDNTYALAYSGLADAYLLLSSYGNLSKAEAVRQADPLIQTALKLDGRMSEGFASLGLLYMSLGKLSAAEAHLRRAVNLDPDNITAHTWYALAIGEQGRKAEEAAILREALSRDPLNMVLNINLASNQLSRGLVDEGFARLENTLQVYPTSTLVLRVLAYWESTYGRMNQAVKHASLALSLAPGEPPNQATMADLLLDLGAVERARSVLKQAFAVGEENMTVLASHARYLYRSERETELRRLAEGLAESGSTDVLAGKEAIMPHYWLGILAADEGKHSEAITHFGVVLSSADALPPMFAIDVLTWQALAHRGSDDDQRARDLMARAEQQLLALELQGVRQPQLSYLSAVIAALKNEPESALEHLSDVVNRGGLDVWGTEHDSRLAALRAKPEFQRLLDSVRQRNAVLLAQVESLQLARN